MKPVNWEKNSNQAWGNPSEITIQGVVEYESLRNILIGLVRGRKPLAVQTFPEKQGMITRSWRS